jgi:hypothetical protein
MLSLSLSTMLMLMLSLMLARLFLNTSLSTMLARLFGLNTPWSRSWLGAPTCRLLRAHMSWAAGVRAAAVCPAMAEATTVSRLHGTQGCQRRGARAVQASVRLSPLRLNRQPATVERTDARANAHGTNKSDWSKDWKRGRTPRVSKALASTPRPPRPKFGPPPYQNIYKMVPVNFWSYLTFIRGEGWKAASSHCKADARSHQEVELPVMPHFAFGELATHMLGKTIGELLRANDSRVGSAEDKTYREQRVRIFDLEELALFDFSAAKADSSVATARASRLGNYNAVIEV